VIRVTALGDSITSGTPGWDPDPLLRFDAALAALGRRAFAEDGLHPSVTGYRLIGERAFKPPR